VKESPKKLQPSHEEKGSQFDDGDSNKQASNQKRFLDIGGGDDDDVVLGASSRSREIMKSGADDKNSFEKVVGQFPSPSHSATELIKGMHYILTQAFQFQ
jgi:hypothetical protein